MQQKTFLTVVVSTAVTTMWVAAGLRAVLTGDTGALTVMSPPFILLCGYLFGISIVRKD